MTIPKGVNGNMGGADALTIAAQALALAKSNETDIDALDHIVHGIANDTGASPALNADTVTPANLKGYSAATGHSMVLRVKADGSGFDFVPLPASAPTRTAMAATVPTTIAGLKVSHLYKDSTGAIPQDSTFDLTNGGTTDLTIKAATAFATGLTLAAKAATYDVLDFATADPYTLSVNATGASMAFTTDVTIPANSTKVFYVRDNG